jgi:hypothetical protein
LRVAAPVGVCVVEAHGGSFARSLDGVVGNWWTVDEVREMVGYFGVGNGWFSDQGVA